MTDADFTARWEQIVADARQAIPDVDGRVYIVASGENRTDDSTYDIESVHLTAAGALHAATVANAATGDMVEQAETRLANSVTTHLWLCNNYRLAHLGIWRRIEQHGVER